MIAEKRMLCDRTGDRREHHVDAKVFLPELPGNAGNGGASQHAGLDLPAELIELTRVGADVLNRRGPRPVEQRTECAVRKGYRTGASAIFMFSRINRSGGGPTSRPDRRLKMIPTASRRPSPQPTGGNVPTIHA